jgi:hypothetical protein
MTLTNAERQASRGERHLKNGNVTKLRAQFIFDASSEPIPDGATGRAVR